MSEAFKFSAEVKSELLDQIEMIVGRIKDGSLSDEQIAAEVKALGTRLPANPAKRRGRPVGARTNSDTPAVKRAREFIRLQVKAGLRPAQAARRVADTSGKDESTIYKEARRHDARLAEEARRERDDIFHAFGIECMERYPGSADPILAAFSDGLEKLALAVEACGNPVAAKHVRAYAPNWKRSAIIAVGMVFLSLPSEPATTN